MYKEQGIIHQRSNDVLGEKEWTWITEDQGAFDGPKMNWVQHHNVKFFKYLRARNVVVTAGASCGMYVRFYAKRFKKVYAFEPDPLSFHCMVSNNPVENVVKMNCALGETNELVAVQRAAVKNSGMHRVDKQHSTSCINYIPCISIDMLRLHACDLIQLDVEGYEEKVIRGSVTTIQKFRPVLIAEMTHRKKELADFIKSLGYVQKDQSVSDTIWVPSEFE